MFLFVLQQHQDQERCDSFIKSDASCLHSFIAYPTQYYKHSLAAAQGESMWMSNMTRVIISIWLFRSNSGSGGRCDTSVRRLTLAVKYRRSRWKNTVRHRMNVIDKVTWHKSLKNQGLLLSDVCLLPLMRSTCAITSNLHTHVCCLKTVT